MTITTVKTIQPDSTAGIDTGIIHDVPSNNTGINTVFSVAGPTNTQKALIKFDLTGIPINATIVSAVLSLVCSTPSASSDSITINRSLVAWFEGNAIGGTTTINGSTWNFRNHIGSVAWTGGAGGVSGTEYAAVATDTKTVNGLGTFTWNVATDVQNFVSGSQINNGWWLLLASAGPRDFRSSDYSVISEHPKLVVTYTAPSSVATCTGNSTASAILKGKGKLSSLAIGSSIVGGIASTNGIAGSVAGTSTVIGAIGSPGRGETVIFGTSTASAVIHGKTHLTVSIAGTSSLSADGSFKGLLHGTTLSGLGILTATGIVLSIGIITGKGCYSDPLLFITDGSLQINNQLNLLNLIDSRIGFLLDDWKPNIAQYKDGGTFSDSPNSTGRSLVKRIFANAIEVFTFSIRGHDEDDLIWHIQQLMSWQEATADYWTSDNPFLPVYIGAKAAKETNTRYAVIKAMSSPQLDNPYAQPFALRNGTAVIDKFTLRLERGDWMSNPPGQSECVAISSQRAWTIAGWSAP